VEPVPNLLLCEPLDGAGSLGSVSRLTLETRRSQGSLPQQVFGPSVRFGDDKVALVPDPYSLIPNPGT
jgi:hypothetical protein